jgi:tetratricopeptide (TPR) repeat protein
MLFESSPLYWAPRMRFLQLRLSGHSRATLWSDLPALAAQTKAAAGRDNIVQDLWSLPAAVQEASQSSNEYKEQASNMLAPYLIHDVGLEARKAHLRGKFSEAIPVYMANRHPAPPMASQSPQAMTAYNWVREDSTYFLGLIKFEQGEYEPSVNWLAKSYLERYPDGKWACGARYHLGRCAEAQQDYAKAIEYYTQDDTCPQGPGNVIRARRLGWTGNHETVASELGSP